MRRNFTDEAVAEVEYLNGIVNELDEELGKCENYVDELVNENIRLEMELEAMKKRVATLETLLKESRDETAQLRGILPIIVDAVIDAAKVVK